MGYMMEGSMKFLNIILLQIELLSLLNNCIGVCDNKTFYYSIF